MEAKKCLYCHKCPNVIIQLGILSESLCLMALGLLKMLLVIEN